MMLSKCFREKVDLRRFLEGAAAGAQVGAGYCLPLEAHARVCGWGQTGSPQWAPAAIVLISSHSLCHPLFPRPTLIGFYMILKLCDLIHR